MVTVKKVSYPSCWVWSKDRRHGVLSLGNNVVIKCEKTQSKSVAKLVKKNPNILDSNRIRVDVASHADVLRGSSRVPAPREVFRIRHKNNTFH